MQILLFALALVLWSCGAAAGADAPAVAGLSHAEALRLGERMYREGILPDGTPMTATAMGDIPVDGRMFTCNNCHRPSGLGSAEGSVVTWPITGQKLFQPRRRTGAWRPPEAEKDRMYGRRSLPPQHRTPDARPAYTDESLAQALRTGVDPTGRSLDRAMPRYVLGNRDMAIMIYYLKNLSREQAPGVDAHVLRFATVVSEDVRPEDRAAMLSVLQAHVAAHNSQNRYQERRAATGPFFHSEMNLRYRRLDLQVWELKGPRGTWRTQLEAYYRERPVFAMLGGMATGSWAPVHDFCEERRIPCLFPMTDLPVVSPTGWYTLYFSKGLHQEGESAAAYLREQVGPGLETRVVQVFRRDDRSAAVARGFRETWAKLGGQAPLDRELAPQDAVSDQEWTEWVETRGSTVVLLWLEDADEALRTLASLRARPRMVFVSSSLLRSDVTAIPDGLREMVYLTYPYSLPREKEKMLPQSAVESYLHSRNIPVTDLKIQAKTWFLGVMLARILKEMRSEFHRDFFLERMEMLTNQDSAIAVYPRLTFGPDQRYASKGCYIVQVTPGPNPTLAKRSDWVTSAR